MRLTRSTCQSISILRRLAAAAPRQHTIGTLAAECGVPVSRVAKLMPRLAAAGYVEAVRGRHGGLRLGMPLEKIPLGAVLLMVEPDFTLVECFDPERNQCRLSPDCRLKGLLQAAAAAFLQRLDRLTVADLGDGGRAPPECAFLQTA